MRRFAFFATLVACAPLCAWGPEGHDLVARIAEAQLNAAVHARVVEILGPGATMASVSSWPDQIRHARPETAPWHYIDIPITEPHFDMARDCPKGDCVIAKIADFRKALADPSTPASARREALMFLIHFVGDMHQPLHCSDNHDKGGNDLHVQFNGQPSNLHSVWDSGLLDRMGSEEELFPALSQESARREKKFAKGTVEDWAEQSHKAAVKMVYGKLPKAAPGQPVVLDAAYEQAADPLIRLQIERAGARLARVLSEALK
ncbi:MAG: S1/P1 nuclease [Bryobacteraceae bacterium]